MRCFIVAYSIADRMERRAGSLFMSPEHVQAGHGGYGSPLGHGCSEVKIEKPKNHIYLVGYRCERVHYSGLVWRPGFRDLLRSVKSLMIYSPCLRWHFPSAKVQGMS